MLKQHTFFDISDQYIQGFQFIIPLKASIHLSSFSFRIVLPSSCVCAHMNPSNITHTKYKGSVSSQYYFFGLRSRLHYLVELFMKQIATQVRLHSSGQGEGGKKNKTILGTWYAPSSYLLCFWNSLAFRSTSSLGGVVLSATTLSFRHTGFCRP